MRPLNTSSASELPSLFSTRPPDELLVARLVALGLDRVPEVREVRTHANRTVMLTLTAHGVLRLHRGYAWAPDRVLRAILRFIAPRTTRAGRRAAEREFVAFPVEEFVPFESARARQPDRPHPGDVRLLHELEQLHRGFNTGHFDGRLAVIPFRLSGRMRSRLGELSVDLKTGRPIEIALSRRHLRRHPWAEVARTVLHEMIHQWQAESGLPLDHGAAFRRKAVEVGVEPAARREVGSRESSAGIAARESRERGQESL